jgi:filamentous hemagglutinin family protein
MKNRFTRFVVLSAVAGLFSHQALAVPANPTLVSGGASFSSGGDTLNIATSGDVLDWSSFSVAAGQTVNFIQPSGSSGVDNYLQGASTLEVFGILHSDGPLTFRADNIYVAPGGVIDAPGLSLIASQSVNMAGLIQGGGLLNIAAPSIFVKGPLVSDGTIVLNSDYQGSGSLNLGSIGGSFSGIEANKPFRPGTATAGWLWGDIVVGDVLTPVPEPAEWMMLAAGLLAVFGLRRKNLGGRAAPSI